MFLQRTVRMGIHIQSAIIVDDDPDLGYVLASVLEKQKIHVLTVQTLHEAEECLTYMKPTYIFLDNSFPEGLGINFIKQIRAADEEIKIIMMTADTSSWIREKAWEEGVNYFLSKPFNVDSIGTVLEKIKPVKH
jgi:DNA-binding response OmpR family regulator